MSSATGMRDVIKCISRHSTTACGQIFRAAIQDFNWKFFALRLAVKFFYFLSRAQSISGVEACDGIIWRSLAQSKEICVWRPPQQTAKNFHNEKREDNLIKNVFFLLLFTFLMSAGFLVAQNFSSSEFLFYCSRMKNDPNSFAVGFFLRAISCKSELECWAK